MIRKFAIYLALLCAVLLTACGGAGGYVIDCDFEGLGNHGVEMVTTDGARVSRQQLHPDNGHFTARGESAQPVLVEFFTLDGGERLLSCVVADGDRLKVEMDMERGASSLSVEGTPVMERYGRWLAENDSLLSTGNHAAANELVKRFVVDDRASLASTLALVTHFHTRGAELLADSVFNLIAAPARPASLTASFASSLGHQTSAVARANIKGFVLPVGRDSTVRFTPMKRAFTLIAFSDTRKPDSVLKMMRALVRDMPAGDFDLIEVSVARDSASWRTAISADSARWRQAWTAGGPASPVVSAMSVAGVPFYILADSMGRQIVRGRSLRECDSVVRAGLAGGLTKETATKSEPSEDKEAVKEPSAPAHSLGGSTLQLKRADEGVTAQ